MAHTATDNAERFALLAKEFPDYQLATLPASFPTGLEDTSWHNDAMPSFQCNLSGAHLFVDYADKALSERPEAPRYRLDQLQRFPEAEGLESHWGWPLNSERTLIVESDDFEGVILPALLGAAFAATLNEWATPEQWQTMRRVNRERNMGTTTCASHDWCDANMAMMEALLTLGLPWCGDFEDGSPEHDSACALWNAAWAHAFTAYLTADPLEALAAEFAEWCADQDMPDVGDALDMLHQDVTPDQRAWLSDFVTRWDAVTKGEG